MTGVSHLREARVEMCVKGGSHPAHGEGDCVQQDCQVHEEIAVAEVVEVVLEFSRRFVSGHNFNRKLEDISEL